jgi:hypothetical protein
MRQKTKLLDISTISTISTIKKLGAPHASRRNEQHRDCLILRAGANSRLRKGGGDIFGSICTRRKGAGTALSREVLVWRWGVAQVLPLQRWGVVQVLVVMALVMPRYDPKAAMARVIQWANTPRNT